MEEIFDKPVENDKKKESLKLRSEGLSYSQIGEKLGVSKQYVAKILSQPAVNQTSTKTPDSSTKSSTNRQLAGQPTAPQGDNDYVTSKEIHLILEEFKEKIQTILEERIQKTLNYYIKNTLDTTINERVTQLKETREAP